ncbi:retrovirus-related pol polyprotein from transposon TNT 1-94 [Tanacetum coccineum]
MVTVRTLLAISSINNWYVQQLDINNAFLYGDLNEEVYMQVPSGYKKPGLKQANRQWYIKLTTFLISLGFIQSHAGSSLFIYYKGLDSLLILIYVDDILLAGNNSTLISEIKDQLHHTFSIKDLGALHYYLGIEFLRNSNGIVVTQRKYALDLIEYANLQNEKPSKTPLDPRVKLTYINGDPRQDPSYYRTLVVKLIYLTINRPDLAFAAHLLMRILCDNISTIAPASNPVQHARTKHIELDCHFVRDKIKGNEGSGRDECIYTNELREGSDELSKSVLNDNACTDGTLDNKCSVPYDKPIEVNTTQKSYANMVKYDELPKILNYIPTLITDSDNKVIDIHKNGQYVFKFKDCDGLNVVLEKGPWMVKSKPLFVTKWNAKMGMEKLEPKCLPVWVKLVNVPLEAWTVEGISAIASSLGKPMMMDTNTATMCHKRIGNFKFARVLMEMVAEKEFKKEIVIQYRDKNNNVKGNKSVKVLYDWKPPACAHCKVFGHETKQCRKGGVSNNGKDDPKPIDPKVGKEDQDNKKHEENGREKYQGYRTNVSNGSYASRTQNTRNQSSQWQYNRNEGGRAPNNKRKEYKKRQVDADSQINQDVGSKAQNNNCNMKGKGVEEIRSSANNFSILNSLPKDNDQEIRILKGRMIVDEFLNKNLQPNLIESMTWSKYMIHYFKEKWESDKQNENNEGIEVEEVEDVSNSSRGTENFIEKNEVNGCRILIGWDNETDVQILHKASQVVFCIISAPKFKFKCYFSFVYAVNEGIDRRDLWKVLINDNRFTHGNPWCIVGDMNVILNPKEHSCGLSIMTSDMIDFQDYLNTIEVEDICSSGLHFTWTKNLYKVKMGNVTGVLKKLDRVMSNEDFIKCFPQAHAKFLPYIIPDHSPAILCVPSNNIQGYSMYQVVKKLKSLKDPLNRLGWSKGNIFKRVENLRKQLQEVQSSIDADPYNHSLRLQEAKLVEDFCKAESDEEKFLHQQAKIKWLCDGDKNNKYLHSVLKGKSNMSKFLGSSYHVQDIISSETLFRRKLSPDVADKMISSISDAEIKRSMFDIDDSKAPGPDGFTTAFFKQAWNIIWVDTYKAVKEFFSSGKMMGELNATLNVLVGFGFHKKMVNWIMQCVTTVAFTLNINGERVGYFRGGRGLRLGYPISPYLFTLIMEVFSLIMLREINKEPLFQYHFGCKSLKVSHVCFANDLLVMCHGDTTFVGIIKRALDEFSVCFGLHPNHSKSTVFFGSMKEDECSAISVILPFVAGKLPVRYLSVPLILLEICLGVNLEPDEWIKDSGCSKHMTGNRKLFSSYKAYNGGNVIFGSNLRGNIIGKGQICDNKCRVTFSEHDSEITKDGKVIGRGIRKKGLYVMKLGNKPEDKICLATIDENSTLWHRRLGHANMRLIQSLASKELVRNLPKLKFDQHLCDACKIGKQAHASHKAKNIVSTTKCLELLHMDLFGPSAVRSYGGNRYTLIIVDDYSRKVEESLNVTFDETPPPSKTSPLVDDDLDKEEAIKVTEKKNLENDIKDKTLEIDEIVNIKESMNHPLENVVGNLNQRTLRLQAQSKCIDYDETYAPVARLKSIRILLAYACALDFKLFQMDVKSATVLSMRSVCLCARFQEAPKTSYLEAVKRIFRYIKATTQLGLWYPKGTVIEIVVYDDSDHAGDYVDRKNTSGQVSHTDMWSLNYLSISAPSKGHYKTTLPSPNVIKSLIQVPRQGQVTRTKNKKTVVVDQNKILTQEIQTHMKPWVDIIYENAICLGGHKDHVSACLCHMLYCIKTSPQYNLAFFILKRIKKTRNKPKKILRYGMLLTRLFKHVVSVSPELSIDHYLSHDLVMYTLAPRYEQKTRSDHGKKRPRDSNASSSSTTLNHLSSSRPLEDTIDENDKESFHSDSSSPSQNVSSLSNVVFRVLQNPTRESQYLNTYLSETINLQTQQ